MNDMQFLLAYPQPASNYLRIDFKSKKNDAKIFNLYDTNGRTLVSKCLDVNSNKLNLDISQINSGIYYIKIESESGVYTKQVQIIR